MATLWLHYGYSMASLWLPLAKHLRNCCRPGAEYHPNIKVAVWHPEVIVKKVKNEHRFIGLRTYVHWPTNLCSSAHEHRFIFSRGAVGIKTVLTCVPQKWQKILKTCHLTLPRYLRDLYLGHRLDKFTVNYRGIHVNFKHGLPVIPFFIKYNIKKNRTFARCYNSSFYGKWKNIVCKSRDYAFHS